MGEKEGALQGDLREAGIWKTTLGAALKISYGRGSKADAFHQDTYSSVMLPVIVARKHGG